MTSTPRSLPEDPSWIAQDRPNWGEKLRIPEWEEGNEYRNQNGWVGTDYLHSPTAPVYIRECYAKFASNSDADKNVDDEDTSNSDKNNSKTTLTGVVLFTPQCESHRGVCHGGSMCSVMDDVIGWCSFLASGECRPWSAYTAQINTKLRRPISAQNTFLRIRATLVRIEKSRKVHVHATLDDPSVMDNEGAPVVHATGEGLAILVDNNSK